MQLRMNVLTRDEAKRCWAFAANQSITRNKDYGIITACSPLARDFGVSNGMRYSDAKLLVPDLRVLIYKN